MDGWIWDRVTGVPSDVLVACSDSVAYGRKPDPLANVRLGSRFVAHRSPAAELSPLLPFPPRTCLLRCIFPMQGGDGKEEEKL